MRKIGIFSGSFDPVHNGHLAFAHQAINRCQLDRVYFLPEPRPRRKQGVKAFEHRVAMLELAIKNQSKLGLIILKQARFNVTETLPKLTARFKNDSLYMLVGEDVLMSMINWPHVKELASAVHFIIGVRTTSKVDLAKHISVIEKTRGLNFSYTIFAADDSTANSSVVRSKLRHGQTPDTIDKKVQNYITRHKLYYSVAE
ncbi:MAG TPA: nicotinate (nicotinamide) nucleotide adenylyltransferase [Candidatus Saccharimonadales bacterium]|nr:nicotinate (nicotinamide) nucleotide adenylyltransferase [Candidatus Saccharimonadales bacterium]